MADPNTTLGHKRASVRAIEIEEAKLYEEYLCAASMQSAWRCKRGWPTRGCVNSMIQVPSYRDHRMDLIRDSLGGCGANQHRLIEDSIQAPDVLESSFSHEIAKLVR